MDNVYKDTPYPPIRCTALLIPVLISFQISLATIKVPVRSVSLIRQVVTKRSNLSLQEPVALLSTKRCTDTLLKAV